MNSLGWTGRLSRWSAGRRWWVISAWALILVVVMVAANAAGGVFTTDIEFTSNPESQQAKRLIEQVRGSEPLAETVIVRNDALTVDDPAFQAQVDAVVQTLRDLPGVVDPQTVASYYETGIEQLVSADRHTTLVPLLLMGSLDESPEKVNTVDSAVHELEQDNFDVLMGGFGSLNEAFNQAAERDLSSESRVLPIAFVILVLVFGARGRRGRADGGRRSSRFSSRSGYRHPALRALAALDFRPEHGAADRPGGRDRLRALHHRALPRGARRGTAVNEAIGVAGDTATRAVLFSRRDGRDRTDGAAHRPDEHLPQLRARRERRRDPVGRGSRSRCSRRCSACWATA